MDLNDRPDPCARELVDSLPPGAFARDRAFKVIESLERAEAMAATLAEALRLTQEYLGDAVLPRIEGWSWYDAMCEYERFLSGSRSSVG